MTPAQQNELWYKYNTFRLRKVKAYKNIVKSALQQQLQFYADHRDVDHLPIQPIADAIKAIYVDAGKLWAHQSYLNVTRQVTSKQFAVSNAKSLQVKGRMPIGFNDDFINSILQYFNLKLLNDAVLPITETTQDYIRNALSVGIAQGLSIDEIVQQMLQSGITETRANVIARTEIAKAASYGEFLGAAKTGLQTQKIWISIRDNRTRLDHREVDGQVQPADKPFIVGNENYQMQRPCVSNSDDGRHVPGKEVINCRCCIGRKVMRDSRGLPLKV